MKITGFNNQERSPSTGLILCYPGRRSVAASRKDRAGPGMDFPLLPASWDRVPLFPGVSGPGGCQRLISPEWPGNGPADSSSGGF
jgi:hypothetical protein